MRAPLPLAARSSTGALARVGDAAAAPAPGDAARQLELLTAIASRTARTAVNARVVRRNGTLRKLAPLACAMCDGDGVIQAAGNSSSVTGGAWARRVGSGSARKPRCSRIFFATSGSSMQAMRRILP